MILVICGVMWNMSWCGTPTSVIITGLITADSGVYSPRSGLLRQGNGNPHD